MDFSYPPEVEQFRKELRAWLAANLTEEVVAAGRRRGRDPDTFETLRAWDATLADAGWGAVSWPQEYGGRGATVLEQLAYAEETITRASAGAAQRDRDEQHRAGDHAVRHGNPEARAAPPHGARRRHLVSGHVGAGSRL